MNSSVTGVTLEEAALRLSEIGGPDFVHFDGARIAVAPGSIEEISEVLRFANANGLSVAPVGGETKSGWGNSAETGILLRMHRLNRLREHPWQDLTCTVEAGCTWSDLQLALKEHGQMVALDALWPGRSTVGGIVATNDSGALRLKYGGLRDLIIGMTIVLADGTIARSGGKVVKNVAGYDLHKLMIGSFGTLGVVTEVNFRLHPIEEFRRNWTARAPEPMTLRGPLSALLDSQLALSSIQIRSAGGEYALDIAVSGLPETVKETGDRIRRIFGQTEMLKSDERIWLERERLFDRKEDLILKVSALPGEICSVISHLRQCAEEAAIDVAIVAQGTGLVTVALSSLPEVLVSFVDRLRDHVMGSGGTVVALQVPENLRGKLDPWGSPPESIELMREIKRRFDPKRILNPGRFMGEI
jgi:glycolate oxidase FAD binding subunit